MTTAPLNRRTLLIAARAVRTAVLRQFTPDSCIASTRVLIDVLGVYGVPAEPLAVDTTAYSPAAWDWVRTRPGEDLPIDDTRVWTVGVDSRAPARPGGWPGHLVARHAGVLVDASVDQFARPARDLRITGPMAAVIPAGWSTPAGMLDRSTGAMVTWTPAAVITPWQDSTNWDPQHPGVAEATTHALHALDQDRAWSLPRA